MKLTYDEIEKAVIDNDKLVYYVVNRKFPWLLGDEDIVQYGMIGLWKACKAWDSDKGTLANLAIRCIQNEILMEIRRRKQQNRLVAVSLDEPQNEESDSKTNISIADMLAFEEPGFVDIEYNVPEFKNKLNQRENIVLSEIMNGVSQQDIADSMCISRSYVSRIVKNIRLKAIKYWQLDKKV